MAAHCGRWPVKVFTGKVEVGQNIRTSLAQLVAEELRVPFDSITMVMGDTDLTPWDMGTFGSRTTPTMGPQLRTMAVAAREMLLEMAAERWHVDAAGLDSRGRQGHRPADFAVAHLRRTHPRREPREDRLRRGALTPATEWKIAGTPVPKAAGRDFVTGSTNILLTSPGRR